MLQINLASLSGLSIQFKFGDLKLQLKQLGATQGAFALWFCGSNSVTWSDETCDDFRLQDLRGVPQLHANNLGFAILADESAGNPDCGGQLRSSRSAHKLVGHRNFEVGRLRSYDAPFRSGIRCFPGCWVSWYTGHASVWLEHLCRPRLARSVHFVQVTVSFCCSPGRWIWIDIACRTADRGGDSSAVRDCLRSLQHVQATDYAFAAILAHWSVVTWGGSVGGSRFRPVMKHLLQSWQIDRSLCGAR